MEQRTQDQAPRYFSNQVTEARRFHLRSSKQRGQSVVILAGGVEYCRPDYTIDRVGFPHTIIEFVASGRGYLLLGDQPRDLLPGAVFTYGRSIPHRITCDPKRPLVKYFLILAGARARSLLSNLGLAPGNLRRLAQPDQIRQIFDDLIEIALSDAAERESNCAHAAHYMIGKIGRSLLLQDNQSDAGAFATYLRCRCFIEENSLKVTEIREVAQFCHVDEAYLCRLFQRFGKERPFHYLQHLRMNHAAAQLQTGTRQIKDIANELAFSDAANFTRAFRRWFGVPPSSLRSGVGE